MHDKHEDILGSLLDGALAAPAAPAGLADRIVAATAPHVARRANRSPVLARIGPALLGLAAVMAFATAASLWVAATTDAPRSSPTGPLAENTVEPEALPLVSFAESELDDQIQLLALYVDVVGARQVWSGPGDSMEEAAVSEGFESLADAGLAF